jgi:hypothetical protein
MTRAATQQHSAKLIPSIITAATSSSERSRPISSASAASVAALNRRDTADFESPRATPSSSTPIGSATRACRRVANPGQHPLHSDLGEQVRRGEHGIGVQLQLATAGQRRPRPPQRHRAAAQHDRTRGGAVAGGDPIRIVPVLQADLGGQLLVHDLAHRQQPGVAAERQQPSRMAPATSASAVASTGSPATRAASCRSATRTTGNFFLPFTVVVPFLARLSLARRPNTYPRQMSGGEPPPQLPQAPGQPRRSSVASSTVAVPCTTTKPGFRKKPWSRLW